jgi:hypothetical protein
MSIPARSIEEKRALLIKELLINMAEIGDILGSSLVVAVQSILFLLIIAEDVYKLILRVGNIAQGIDEIPTPILRLTWL